MPAGRPKKYHSDEERKAARKAQKKAARQKRKGAKSWLGIVEKKLSNAAEGIAPEPKDETPPERSGEPFADLPPLDLPAANATSSDTPAGDQQTPEGSADPATKDSASPPPEIEFDSEELQAMAEMAAHGTVMFLGKYAAERGKPALGEMFAKLAGMSARIIVRERAKSIGISSEEAAAWTLFPILGINAGSAGWAWWDEYQLKKQEKMRARQSAAGVAEQHRQQNGVTPATVAEQRKQQQEHADEARRTSGPVV